MARPRHPSATIITIFLLLASFLSTHALPRNRFRPKLVGTLVPMIVNHPHSTYTVHVVASTPHPTRSLPVATVSSEDVQARSVQMGTFSTEPHRTGSEEDPPLPASIKRGEGQSMDGSENVQERSFDTSSDQLNPAEKDRIMPIGMFMYIPKDKDEADSISPFKWPLEFEGSVKPVPWKHWDPKREIMVDDELEEEEEKRAFASEASTALEDPNSSESYYLNAVIEWLRREILDWVTEKGKQRQLKWDEEHKLPSLPADIRQKLASYSKNDGSSNLAKKDTLIADSVTEEPHLKIDGDGSGVGGADSDKQKFALGIESIILICILAPSSIAAIGIVVYLFWNRIDRYRGSKNKLPYMSGGGPALDSQHERGEGGNQPQRDGSKKDGFIKRMFSRWRPEKSSPQVDLHCHPLEPVLSLRQASRRRDNSPVSAFPTFSTTQDPENRQGTTAQRAVLASALQHQTAGPETLRDRRKSMRERWLSSLFLFKTPGTDVSDTLRSRTSTDKRRQREKAEASNAARMHIRDIWTTNRPAGQDTVDATDAETAGHTEGNEKQLPTSPKLVRFAAEHRLGDPRTPDIHFASDGASVVDETGTDNSSVTHLRHNPKLVCNMARENDAPTFLGKALASKHVVAGGSTATQVCRPPTPHKFSKSIIECREVSDGSTDDDIPPFSLDSDLYPQIAEHKVVKSNTSRGLSTRKQPDLSSAATTASGMEQVDGAGGAKSEDEEIIGALENMSVVTTADYRTYARFVPPYKVTDEHDAVTSLVFTEEGNSEDDFRQAGFV